MTFRRISAGRTKIPTKNDQVENNLNLLSSLIFSVVESPLFPLFLPPTSEKRGGGAKKNEPPPPKGGKGPNRAEMTSVCLLTSPSHERSLVRVPPPPTVLISCEIRTFSALLCPITCFPFFLTQTLTPTGADSGKDYTARIGYCPSSGRLSSARRWSHGRRCPA